jgi:competence protein ComEA
VRLTSRRSDDADVIRARLRALLAENDRTGGWLPDDDVADADDLTAWSSEHGWPEDNRVTVPAPDDPDVGLPDGLGRHRAPGRAVRWDPGRPGARSLWVAGLVAALLLIGWTWLNRPSVEPMSGGTLAPSTEQSSTEQPSTEQSSTEQPSTGQPSTEQAPGQPTAAPASPPVGEVADTSTTVVVSVVGLVARPGLVTLPSGARVAEAVEAAGGLLPEADPASVNLAAVVTDGQQVAVGVPAVPGAAAPGAGAAPAGPLDLNTAGVAELDTLPGIGPVLAQRIVDHRTREGPFTSIDQLDDVPGIGPSTAAELAGLVGV